MVHVLLKLDISWQNKNLQGKSLSELLSTAENIAGGNNVPSLRPHQGQVIYEV